MFKLNNISVGANITTPYMLERTWSSTITTTDTVGMTTLSSSGIDEMKVPLAYRIGISITPARQFRASLDYESIPYSSNTFEFSSDNAAHRDWVDLNSLRFGVEYKPLNFLALLAGYQNVSQEFVPDGAAFRDRGPTAESYTLGASLYALYGRFDVAYEMRTLKYYDSYYSNTNFALEKTNYLMFGYTFFLNQL